MEIQERVVPRQSLRTILRRIPERISQTVERFFYHLGLRIAQQPNRWLLVSFIMISICLAGLFSFRQEKNPLKLWVPPDSDFVHDTEWLMTKFGEGLRVESVIMTGDNVLEQKALIKLNEITKQVISAQTSNKETSWTDVCFKVPVISGIMDPSNRRRRDIDIFDDDFFNQAPGSAINTTIFEPSVHADNKLYCKILNSLPRACLILSILDIWNFDNSEVEIDTNEDIIRKINTVHVSPTLGHFMNFTDLLGGVVFDKQGRIVAAKAVKTQWMVYVNFSNVNMDEQGNDAGTADWATEDVMAWETAYLRVLKKNAIDLVRSKDTNQSLKLWYEAGRSFGDISSTTLFQDIDKLAIGIILMFAYVTTILSRFNWVEWRFCLTGTGLLCVGGAFIVAVGLCSLIGIPYGPVHTSLPFMLLGLGVDDIFVMMASWNQIHTLEANREKPVYERVGLMLGHAGSAICITSLTDVVAFVIGASTILPSLQSFCIYAAVGVLVTFLLQITFFVGFFSLDAKRIENKRNGALPCIVHRNFVLKPVNPSETFSWKLIHRLYSGIVLTIPGKVIILLVTIAAAAAGIMGSLQLEQWFDPVWFLPKDSYLSEFIAVRSQYYSQRGFDASLFIGDVNYPSEFTNILGLTQRLANLSSVESLDSWPERLIEFVSTYYQKDLTKTTLDYDDFQFYLSKFLFSRAGGKYQRNFRWDGKLTCGESAPRILISSVDFSFVKFTGPHQWIPAMDDTKRLAKESGIYGFVMVWTKMFGTWVTDKLIAQEVFRNLLLALICVMGTTAVLIAELQTCFWILLCVLLTLLNVCGFMFFWGLTIDIVSCIGLELAVGLSVDYAAHVAHAFLNAASRREEHGQDRTMRTLIAVRHIGAAVAFGAGSTMLGLSMMSLSQTYVFRAFFKIFFLVIVFGLWHGLFLLPVILSTIGPRSLRTHEDDARPEKADANADNEVTRPFNKDTDST